MGRPWLRWGTLGLVLLMLLYSLSNYYFDPRYSKENFRDAARYVSAHARPGDGIVTTNCRSVFDLYYVGPAVVEDLSYVCAGGGPHVEKTLDGVVSGADRIWLVQVRPWEFDPHGMAETCLHRRFGLLEETRFAGIRVSLFDVHGKRGPRP